MVNVRPMRIPGRWREGYVLDYHTLGSTYLGDDEYGHPMFDTKRSDVGELLYCLKYRNDVSVLDELVDTAARFVRSWNPGVTVLVPVPPSRARSQQPVHLIIEALGRTMGVPVDLCRSGTADERARARTTRLAAFDCRRGGRVRRPNLQRSTPPAALRDRVDPPALGIAALAQRPARLS